MARCAVDVQTSLFDQHPEQPERHEPSLRLEDLLPTQLGNAVSRLFDCMGIAEDEIDAAKARDPLNADLVHNAFQYLRPTGPLGGREKLYRAHCQELIARVGRSVPEAQMDVATDAEILGALADLSTHAPLARDFYLLYSALFMKLFPSEAAQIDSMRGPLDTYEEQRIQELDAEFRRKLAVSRATA